MPQELQPLEYRSVPPRVLIRPRRLIAQVYLSAALSVFALLLDVWSGFDWETKHLATVGAVFGIYGLAAAIVCFARGMLFQSDKWLLSLAGFSASWLRR